ncbi:MAG: hypothetical protein K6B51_05240 [Bacilli bacterium]|nr:hypothetical protein [Bacilli bacterium]
MKKTFIKVLTAVAAIATVAGGLTSCGESNDSGMDASNSAVRDVKIAIDAVSNLCYGEEVDFSGKIHVSVDGKAVNASYTLNSLTPDTVVIDEARPSVAVVIGVGKCKVAVVAEGQTAEVEFESYAAVSHIRVLSPKGDLTVGQTINLDDYVDVVVANPVGAKGQYVASVQTENVAKLDDDGHTLHLLCGGALRVKVSDLSGTQTAYFTGNVVSDLQKKFAAKIATFGRNYHVYSASSQSSGAFDPDCPVIHTDHYVAIPMSYYSSSWRQSGNLTYNIFIDWDGKTYNYQANHLTGNHFMPDLSTIKMIERMRYGFDAYYPTASLYSNDVKDNYYSIWQGFKSHYDANGKEDYLYKSSNANLIDAIFATGLGMGVDDSNISEVRVNIEKIFADDEEEAVVFTVVYRDGDTFSLAFTDVGEANYAPLDAYLANPDNKPAKINGDEVKETIRSLAENGNFTVTSRTYLCEEGTEKEWDYAKATSPANGGAAWFHTMYYSGRSRYTENAMIVENIQSYEGVEGLTSEANHHYNHGFFEKDGRVHQVNFTTKGAINGSSALPTEVTSYHDAFKTIRSFDFDAFDEFDFLNVKENNRYDFTIGPKSKKGSANLRSLTYMAQPEQTTEMFRENVEDNAGESAYFGQGYIQLLQNGAYRFFYYIDINAYNSVFGGYFSFRIAFDYVISDIGTTTIPEYASLMA